MKKLSREEFVNEFVSPIMNHDFIKNNCEFRFYWSGKEVEEKESLKLSSNSCGTTHFVHETFKRIGIIILSFRLNQFDVLKTFVHEVAHVILHNCSEFYDLDKSMEEIEAEGIVQAVFEELDFPYYGDYIEDYQNKYIKEHGERYYIEDDRTLLYYDLIEVFVDVYKHKIDLIKELPTENKEIKRKAKYIVTCPKCNCIWKYKNKSKIIKKNGKGFHCGKCGEETMDKLIVAKVQS